MNFELNEEQKLLQQTVRSFARKDSPVTRARELRGDTQGYSREMWRRMAELGWLGLCFPESLGGFGGTMIEASLLLEELGKTLVPEPILDAIILAGTALCEAGSEAQRKRWLEPALEGERMLALAHLETDRQLDPGAATTAARPNAGGGYTLSGAKRWVLGGQGADVLLVSARLADAVALFAVDRDAPGVEVRPVSLIDGRRAAMVVLREVRLDDDRLLGDPTAGEPALRRAFERAAVGACAEGVGVMGASLEMTVDYLETREQFGRKIGAFQALQHRCVDMFVECELMRSAALEAAIRCDGAAHGPDAEQRVAAISSAKLQLDRGGRFVTQQAIQLHGGIGITDEHDIGLFFKRMHALNTLYGDEAHHIARFADRAAFLGET